MRAPRHLWLASLIALGCTPGIDDPARFQDPELCDMDIQQDLLVPRCAREGCHVPEDPASGIDYLSGGLEERLVGRPSFGCADRLVIDPSSPDESYLLERLEDSPMCGDTMVPSMPLDGRGELNEHELDCLRRWVRSFAAGGAPDGGAP